MICPVRGKLGIMCPSAEKLWEKMTGNLPITLTSLVPAILRKCQFLFCVCVFLVARMDTTSGILIVLCLKSRISKDQDWLTDLITLDMFNWTLICWEDTTIGEEGVWSMEVQNTLFYGYYYCKEWREQHLICVEIAISCNSCIYWVYGRRLLNQLLET